ncbi:MAG: VWA domain-containing protein, partial [Myxococcales bacterium]|nr:VWA domain-containing protein [Myxococcales bacterium]
VKNVASGVANLNWNAYGAGEATEASDVVVGSFDLDSRQFSTGGMSGATAVQVTARRSADLVFAPVLGLIGLGFGPPTVEATSVAALGERDIVLVQDVTLSFVEEIDEARNALSAFTLAMVNQSISGDRIGLVTFNQEASEELPLTPIPGDVSAVLDAIDTFANCTAADAGSDPAHPCYGTDIAPGIDAAVSEFQSASDDRAEKVIVLVSDGVPCLPFNTTETLARRDAALASALAAEAAGISVYSVFLDKPIVDNIYCWMVDSNAADPDFMEELAVGNGRFFATPDEEDLDDILVSIVRGLRVRLVN